MLQACVHDMHTYKSGDGSFIETLASEAAHVLRQLTSAHVSAAVRRVTPTHDYMSTAHSATWL